MNRQISLKRAVALAADGFYPESDRLGALAARCFGHGGGLAGRTQIKGLEALANSALMVADVLDFIKKQIGRDTDRLERQSWRRENFGEQLLQFLDRDLRALVGTLDPESPITEPRERQMTHLMLIRQFLRQVSAQYEYYQAAPSGGHPEQRRHG